MSEGARGRSLRRCTVVNHRKLAWWRPASKVNTGGWDVDILSRRDCGSLFRRAQPSELSRNRAILPKCGVVLAERLLGLAKSLFDQDTAGMGCTSIGKLTVAKQQSRLERSRGFRSSVLKMQAWRAFLCVSVLPAAVGYCRCDPAGQ